MTTSQRLENSVWRMKPVACGNQTYSTGTFSSAATISAILFSKPSPLSLENGRLAGSAHTRSDSRLTRSIRCPSPARAAGAGSAQTETPSSAAAILSTAVALLGAKAGLLMFGRRLGFVGAPGRAPAWQRAVRAGLEIDVDVVDVAHHVGIIAECRHHALPRRAHPLATAGDHQQEVRVARGLHRLDEARGVGRPLA